MAATNEQIAALEAALYSGELRVSFEGRDVTYRSTEELRKALSDARASQQVASGARNRVTRLYMGSNS